MQISKFTTRLLHIFLGLSILFFCGFGFMLLKKEVIPAFKNDETQQYEIRKLEYGISEIRVYKNGHFLKDDLDVSHQYGFSLIAEDDQINYASSNVANGILPAPFLSKFGLDETPKIPSEKYESAFYLGYLKDTEQELSRFPAFRFKDYLPKEMKNDVLKSNQIEVKQISTDGKMMVYLVLNFEYN
ncbi:hypothetical protein [Pedobacter punctiformis]|uniref:Uncharacterized protein n=1 Tax=Pedobacter punctiformis TaxID=3004097 RepID=A0ABT4LD66_9SPHI|nr:hypothetical protein [Pedobacter sp. HCMS5-2]MCZ4245848.1 hypothetical protein [Pedobacter sp. HCMS5-2]